MNRRSPPSLLRFALTLGMTAATAGGMQLFAQTGLRAEAGKTVIGSGAISATDSQTRLSGTLGQPIIGTTLAQAVEAAQGFWYARPTTAIASLSGEGAPAAALQLSTSPNPFSRSTTLSFDIPERGRVSLVLYNGIGRQVRTIIDAEREAGTNTEVVDLSGLPSGSYTAALRTGNAYTTATLLLVE